MIEITQEDRAMVEKVELFAQDYQNYSVVTKEELERGNEHIKIISKKWKELDEKRKNIADPINKAKQAVQDLFNPPLNRLKLLKDKINQEMKGYIRVEEEKRLKLEREAQEKARLEEIRQKEKLEKRADKWEEKGNDDKAEGLRQQVEEVFEPAPVIEKVDTNIDKRFVKFTWKARVTNITKLLDHVIKTGDMVLIQPNEKVLNNRSKENKKEGEIIPGVEFYKV